MVKRLQVVLNEEAWAVVDAIYNEATQNFECGSINYSDVINEMLLGAKVDIKTLQAKHTDVSKSLRLLANQKDLDLEAAIKSLQELRAKTAKRKVAASSEEVS